MDGYQKQLDSWREREAVRLVAAAVRLNGSLVWHGVSQGRDAGVSVPASPSSRFPIYSITKTFTSVCVLQLAQAGLVTLDDPVDRWMGRLPGYGAVSLRQLLQHRSGLPDYGGLAAYHDAVRDTPSAPWSEQTFLDMTLARGPLFAPDTGWRYSNIGYLLLRRVIERAAGVSFRRYVDAHIASRLGLGDTFVAETIEDWATCVPGYGGEVRADGALVDVRSTYHPGWCAPGVAVSTVDDVTEFYDGLFRGALLDRAHLDRMLCLVPVPGRHPGTVTPSSGLGILGDPDAPDGPSFGHGGGGPGYALAASIVPGSTSGRLATAVFCNSSHGADVSGAEAALVREAMDHAA